MVKAMTIFVCMCIWENSVPRAGKVKENFIHVKGAFCREIKLTYVLEIELENIFQIIQIGAISDDIKRIISADFE